MTPSGAGFLKFKNNPQKLYVTADEDEFDSTFLQHLSDEGFDVTYLPWHGGGKPYKTALAHLADDLELSESYAVVAFASAASDCLDFYRKPERKITALIAYYPTHIPSPQTRYPSQLEVLCHIAGTQPFAPAFSSYTYRNTEPGFAEYDLLEHDKVAASLAWTRTLGTLRRASKIDTHTRSLEHVREEHISRLHITKDASEVAEGFVSEGYVNNVPTMTGGIGQMELYAFYRDEYIAKSPPSLDMRLVSRTAGVDRIVDEFVMSFSHTQEISWILPGVLPTNRFVTVGMVSIVCVRGGKLYSEHVYWDQASVLVQVGLLNPQLVPEKFQKQGLNRLPVSGEDAAAKILDEESGPSNSLIPGWQNAPSRGITGALPARPKRAAAIGSGQP